MKKWTIAVACAIFMLATFFILKASMVSASPGQTSSCNSCHSQSSSLNVITDITARTVSPGQSFPVSISWSGGTNGRRTEVNWPNTQSNNLFSPSPRIPFSSSTNAASGTTTSTLTAPSTPGNYTVRVFIARGSPRDTGYTDIAVTVVAANAAPVLAAIGNKSVITGQLLQFTASATDPNGDTLTYSATNLPAGASFNTSTRVFSWTPATGQAGIYTGVRFQVSDGTLADFENITITVDGPPVLSAIGNKSVVTGQLLRFTVSATDPDDDPLTYSISNLPSGGHL